MFLSVFSLHNIFCEWVFQLHIYRTVTNNRCHCERRRRVAISNQPQHFICLPDCRRKCRCLPAAVLSCPAKKVPKECGWGGYPAPCSRKASHLPRSCCGARHIPRRERRRHLPPVWGAPISSLPTARLRQLSTPAHAYALLHLPPAAQSNAAAATRSGRCFRHWRRSLRSPRRS